MPPALEVLETGDRLVFHVRSETRRGKVYKVDLLAHDGRSECICKDWQCRCWPIVKEGGRAACKHVRAARDYFLDDLLAVMAARESETASL